MLPRGSRNGRRKDFMSSNGEKRWSAARASRLGGNQLRKAPASADAAAQAKSQPTVDRAADRRLRILVAEDNVPSQHVAKAMLGSAGYEVDIACDGHQAVSMGEGGRYDVILMDVCMPGIDGMEAAKRIRMSEHAKNIAIIGLTADVTTEPDFGNVGMDRHFLKPVDWDELIAVLDELEQAATPLAEMVSS